MIAITGGDTAIGRQLIEVLLSKGRRVRVLTQDPDRTSDSELLTYVTGTVFDISSLEILLEGVEQIYHLDSLNTLERVDKHLLYKTNVDGTANVVNVALTAGVKELLFSSTIYSLGDKKEGDVLDEKARWSNMKLASGYGWSMHLAEREIWRGVAEGLRAVITHTGLVLSPPAKPDVSSRLMHYCLQSEEAYPEGIVHVIDVRDAVATMTYLMDDIEDPRQMILYTSKLSFRELMGKLSSVFSKNPPAKAISYVTLVRQALKGRMFGRLFKKHRPIMTKALAQVLSDRRSFSNFNFLEIQNHASIPIDDSLKLYCGLYEE